MARLRLFAILREAAGTGSAEVPGETVAEVVANATARFGPNFARALLTAQTWVNGERAGPATPVHDDDEVALIPPVSGGTTVVRSPAGLEVVLLAAVTAFLFVGNALSPQWFAVAVVLTGLLWGYDIAGAAGRRGLGVGAVPIILSVTAGTLASYRFGHTGLAAATVGAVLLAMAWSVLTPHLRPIESISTGALLSAMGAFGAGALMVLRLRSEAEMTSFLLVAAVAILASWVAASTDLAPVDPLTTAVLAALGAGVLAGAVWSEDLWPTVVAAAAAAAGLVAGRNVGSLARFGGFYLTGATQGSLVHLDGMIPAAGGFWLVLHLLV
ncbi:MAG: MoaD/ThiS family protein [Acidimicrobiia bacterium]|jgi:molybdopterin converting factor small subunit|nr:MoaD/ThiS family protein [Acidimicrobiia bacterium]